MKSTSDKIQDAYNICSIILTGILVIIAARTLRYAKMQGIAAKKGADTDERVTRMEARHRADIEVLDEPCSIHDLQTISIKKDFCTHANVKKRLEARLKTTSDRVDLLEAVKATVSVGVQVDEVDVAIEDVRERMNKVFAASQRRLIAQGLV